jgi:NAD(P)-dependent dehydrogenase (short-subunit alcohol dehydrogenase family)
LKKKNQKTFIGKELKMDLGLAGKKALITGASRGIGRAIAGVFAAEGCALALASRDRSALEAAAAELRAAHPGIAITIHPADLSRTADQEALARACPEIDILVNNAGANPPGTLAEIDDATWRAAWDLKMFGFINLTRACYAGMAARRTGVIINIIGAAGERLNANYILGSTGNAGLMAFTRALGSASPADGVRVVGINPGLTATERATMLVESWSRTAFGTPDRWAELPQVKNLPFGRMAAAREVADLAAFLASERAGYISGTIVTIDGGAANRH